MRTIVAIGIAGAVGALARMLTLERVQIVSYRSSDE
jgi:fluoride ion exporter CrcB/FEX